MSKEANFCLALNYYKNAFNYHMWNDLMGN